MIVTSVHLVGLDELKRRWGWFVGLGVALVLLGSLAVMASVVFTLASVLFFGCLMIIGGMLQTAHAVVARKWGGSFLDLLVGLLNLAVGLMVVANPMAAAAALTLLISLCLILGGVFRLGLLLAIRFQHAIWLLVHALVNLLLGILILQQWPMSGLWVIGLFVGIDMVFNGWSLIMLGLAARRMKTTP